MADLSLTPVSTQIKPVQGASIGDMINMARGAQQYQQAEQVNPLALQQQQQLTRTGEINLNVAEQANNERINMQKFFADPNNFQTDNRIDLDKINRVVPTIAPLTGADYITKFTTLGNAQTTAEKATSELGQDDRALIANPISVLGYAGVTDPKAYAKVIKQTIEQNKKNPRLVSLGDSYLTQLEFADPNQLPDIAIRASQNLLSPAQAKTAFAPTITTTEGGRTVIFQPSIGAAAPTATVNVLGGLQAPSAPSGPIGAGTEVAPGMRVPYPVRSASQPYIPEPTEVKDQTSGQAYRDSLVTAQTGLAQNRRNVEEVIQQANKIGEELMVPNILARFGFEKGGAPEKAERAVRQFFGSEQYDMLAKDLANLAITNSKAMGAVGGTVAGLDMASVANGTTKVTPDVLVKIARRVQADQTNLDMQANGAQQFAQRFGDNNMKAYQQAWNANADTKIFEAMNIIRDVTKLERQKEELNRLFPNANQYKEFLTKYRNLKQLSQNGVVGGQ
jgi:hypothetical protein